MQQFLNFFKTLDTYKAEYRLRRAQIRGKLLRVFENDAAPLAIEYDRLPAGPGRKPPDLPAAGCFSFSGQAPALIYSG